MSKVLIVNECHLEKTPDENYWSNGIVDYSVFKRYLSVFDEVVVAIRVSNVLEKDTDYVHRCNGDGVKIISIPDFIGISGYIRNYFYVTTMIKKCCEIVDCAIIRTPSAVSFQFLSIIDGKIPYALEVSGDPWKHMAPGEYKSRFRPVIRRMWTEGLKKYCMKANGVSYVTEKVLQKRYPCKAIIEDESENYFTSYYSTVSINDEKTYMPKIYEEKQKYRLIHIANAFTTYSKGHKEAMEVIKRLNDDRIDTSIDFVGDGPLREEFKQYAKKLGIAKKVHFAGRLNSKEDIYTALRKADLFLFPTHSEGLPRVVIESMHVGTPCVSTNVGGIPELLDKQCISKVGDIEKMYSTVKTLIKNPMYMSELSKRCVERAKNYQEDKLQERRIIFMKRLEALCGR